LPVVFLQSTANSSSASLAYDVDSQPNVSLIRLRMPRARRLQRRGRTALEISEVVAVDHEQRHGFAGLDRGSEHDGQPLVEGDTAERACQTRRAGRALPARAVCRRRSLGGSEAIARFRSKQKTALGMPQGNGEVAPQNCAPTASRALSTQDDRSRCRRIASKSRVIFAYR
jgi:hypothetical protein